VILGFHSTFSLFGVLMPKGERDLRGFALHCLHLRVFMFPFSFASNMFFSELYVCLCLVELVMVIVRFLWTFVSLL